MFLRHIILIAAWVLIGGMTGAGANPDVQLTGTTITGRVVSEPDGKESAGVVVTLWNGSGGNNRTARTDGAGSYSFADVAPGDQYKVRIQEWPNKEAGIWSEGVLIRVKDSPIRAEDLCLTLPQSISGTTTDQRSGKPVAGVEINFSTADKNRSTVKTDSEGHYRLFVTPREVDLQCNGTKERYYTSDPKRKIAVPAGKNITGVNFNVKDSPSFTGLVVYPDGSPAKDLEVLVRIRWSSRQARFGEADGIGFGHGFHLKTDAQGALLGYMRRPVPRDWEEIVELKAIARLPDGTMGGVARAKTNSEEHRIDPLKVVLAKSAAVKVRVVNADGEPITDAKVTASDIYPGLFMNQGGPVKHLGEGKYSMTNLVPGLDYYFTIEAMGYQKSARPKELVLQPDEMHDLGDIRLEWWGQKAVPDLLKKLQSTEASTREHAARQLGELGEDAADAVPALIEKLNQDPRNTVRFGVATALGKIGPAAMQAVPDLIRALQDDTGGGVQREAATALGLIGDSSALPFLKDALKSSAFDVPTAAAKSIELLEKDLKEATPGKVSP